MNDIPLTVTKFTADLGVLIDPYLKFDIHIRDIAMRAKQRAAIIHRCFVSRNTHNLVCAFKIYVRPLLEYASQIWNPSLKYQTDLIESVQRTFTKRLPGFANLTYAERLLNLQLQSLQQRRLLFDLKMCYNIVYGVCDLCGVYTIQLSDRPVGPTGRSDRSVQQLDRVNGRPTGRPDRSDESNMSNSSNRSDQQLHR